MRPIAFAIIIAALAHGTPANAQRPVRTTLAAAISDAKLVGRTVQIDACVALPMTDTNSTDVVLHPCGAAKDERLAELAIIGRITSGEIAQPFHDADVSFLGEVRAKLVGVLTREGSEAEGGVYSVLTIQQVIGPSQFSLPE